MAIITPRRRFLLTVPLALLLPAGLLTYLGLQMVGGIESQNLEQIQTLVDGITHKVRNESTEKIDSLISTQFRPAVQDQLDAIFPDFPPSDEFRFELNRDLPFADKIFFFDSDENLYFFEHSASGLDTDWVRVSNSSGGFRDWLVRLIENENKVMKENFSEALTAEGIYRYRVAPYPDRLFLEQVMVEQREIAAFAIIGQGEESNGNTDAIRITALGFTFDPGYINQRFFQEILDENWDTNQLRYPVAIVDSITRTRVATISELGFPYAEDSSIFRPREFSDYFRWYRIHFSSATGEDIMSIADTQKMVLYSLIAAANLIMITAIIGALRNISQELALSDLRSDFVARVSHELRTPLGLIRLYAETLELGRTTDPEKQKEYLHAITKESERLSHLINNILNFSQIEAQRKHYKLINTPVDSVVEDAADTIRYHLERKGFSFKVEIDDNLPLVMCDRDAMSLAVYNLLSNAMKYSSDVKEIEVKTFTSSSEVWIQVKDCGIGIPKEAQKKIFHEFYRVDNPQVRETGGSGLGLAVTRHIVEGHHGIITVESEPGKGSVFTIRLPVHESD